MKQAQPRIAEEKKARLIKTADSLLSVANLILIFKASTQVQADNPSSLIEYCAVYLLLAVSFLIQAAAVRQRDKLSFVKNICCAAVLVASGTAWLFFGISVTGAAILMEGCLLVILANCIIGAIRAKRIVGRVICIILSLAAALLIIAAVHLTEDRIGHLLITHAVLIGGYTLLHIILISFAKIRLSVLRKIIHKTFAGEIFIGLLLLIVTFSFIFQAVEPGIKTYFDALWYCFALVTTTGFGDLSVTSVLSRVLSIILGIYAIVCVAVVTSVIVNFYNEVKDDGKAEDTDSIDSNV